tara:strand:- start:462 stop:641 length:180 start_codon:yes stop_codon:yes gene_type:complete
MVLIQFFQQLHQQVEVIQELVLVLALAQEIQVDQVVAEDLQQDHFLLQLEMVEQEIHLL